MKRSAQSSRPAEPPFSIRWSRYPKTLQSAEGRRAIVLITDGYDEHSVATFEEALIAVKRAQATVYVVGIGGVAGISIQGERLLKRIAVETGGRFFFPHETFSSGKCTTH